MWRNIQAAVEENLCAGRYDHDDEVDMYLLTYHQQKIYCQQTNEQTEVTQDEVVPPEVPYLSLITL